MYRSLALLALASIFATPSFAEPYAVGDRIEPFTLEDQHGEPQEIGGAVKVILFSADMDGGDLLKAALEGEEAAALSDRGAVYVSNISGMPKLVAKMFALPSMRKRGYLLALDRDGTATARLPGEAGKATLIFLDDLNIERIAHVDSAAGVREGLGLGEKQD